MLRFNQLAWVACGRPGATPVCAERAGLLPELTDARTLLHLFTSNLLNVLLLAIPFGWAAHFAKWPALAVFILVRPCQSPMLCCGQPHRKVAVEYRTGARSPTTLFTSASTWLRS